MKLLPIIALTALFSASLVAEVNECEVTSSLYQEIINHDTPSFDAVRFNEKLTNLLERMDGDKEWVIETVNYAGSTDFRQNPILAVGLREWFSFLDIKNADHMEHFQVAWDSLVPAKKMKFIEELDRLINQSEFLQSDWVNPGPEFIKKATLLTQSGLELPSAIKFIQVWKNLTSEGRRLMLYITLRDNLPELVKYVPLSVSTPRHQALLAQRRNTIRVPDPREKRQFYQKRKEFLTLEVQQDLAKIGEEFNSRRISTAAFYTKLKSWLRNAEVLSPDDFYYLAYIRLEYARTRHYISPPFNHGFDLSRNAAEIAIKLNSGSFSLETRGVFLLMAAEKLSQPLGEGELEALLPKRFREAALVLAFKEISEAGQDEVE